MNIEKITINNNIQDQLVSFEIAKLLKEAGFHVPCRSFYQMHGEHSDIGWHPKYKIQVPNADYNAYPNNPNAKPFYKYGYSAPTQQLAIDWIRVNWSIHVEIMLVKGNKYTFQPYKERTDLELGSERIGNTERIFNTPEEAKESALEYCLTKLILKK